MKRVRLACLLVGLGLACSGQTTTTPSSNGGDGGSSGTGGTGGNGGAKPTCPEDFDAQTGSVCQTLVVGCSTEACARADGVWMCCPPCPCADGWSCTWLGDRNACVPAQLASCVNPVDGGTGGSAGTGGVGPGGSGGVGGGGGIGGGPLGGSGGVGGGGVGGGSVGGSGGTGTCNGDPACYGKEASFCSADGMRLLSCQPADACPAVTECTAFCSACTCHMAPPRQRRAAWNLRHLHERRRMHGWHQVP